MSPIGRLFIILNLILAAAFIAFAGFYLKNQTSYKTKLQESVAAAEAAKKSFEEQIVALGGQVQNYTLDLSSKTQQLANSQTVIKSLTEADTDNKQQLQRLSTSLEAIRAASETVSGKLEDQSTRIETLTKEWVAANEAKMQAGGARDRGGPGRSSRRGSGRGGGRGRRAHGRGGLRRDRGGRAVLAMPSKTGSAPSRRASPRRSSASRASSPISMS